MVHWFAELLVIGTQYIDRTLRLRLMLLLQLFVGMTHTRTLLDQRVTFTRVVLVQEQCRRQCCWIYDVCTHFKVSCFVRCIFIAVETRNTHHG